MDSIEKSSLPCSGEKLGEDETGVQEVGEDSDSSELDDVMIIGEHKMIDDELVCDNYLKEDLEDFISDEVVSDSYLSGDIGQLISCEVGQLCDNLPNVHGDSSNFLSWSGPDDSDYSKLVSNELNSHCKNKEIIDLTANSPEINFDHNETIISSETSFYHNQATNSSDINVHHNQNTNSPTTFFDYNQATNSSETNIDHNQPNNSSEANVDHNETTDSSEISVNHNQPTISSETNVDHNQAANSSETNFDHSQSTNSPKRNVYHNQTIDSSETNVDHNQPTNSSETNVNYTQATDSSEISVDHNQADNSSETDFGHSQSTNSPEIDFDHSQSTNSPEIDFDHSQSTNSPETNIDHSQSTNSPETNVDHSQNTNSPETNVDHNQTANSSEISVDHNQADNSSETDFDHSQSTNSPETNVDHNQTTNSSETNVDHNQNINSPTTIFDYNQATNSPEINGDHNQPNNSPKTNLDHNETTDSSEINVDHDQVTNSSETNFNHTQSTNSPETNVNHNQVTNNSEINFDHSQSTNGPETNVDLNQATNSSETNFDLSQSTNSLETKLFVDHNQPTNSSETNVDHNQATNSSEINFDHSQNTNSSETNVDHNQATNSSETNFDLSQNTNSSETNFHHSQTTTTSPRINFVHNQTTNNPEINFDCKELGVACDSHENNNNNNDDNDTENLTQNKCLQNATSTSDLKVDNLIASNSCCELEVKNTINNTSTIIVSKTNVITEVTRDENCEGREVVELGNIITDKSPLLNSSPSESGGSVSELKVDNLNTSESCDGLSVKSANNAISDVTIPQKLYEISANDVSAEVTSNKSCEQKGFEKGNKDADKLLNSSSSIEIKAAGVSPLNENIENVESNEVNKPESVKYEENVPRPKRGRGRPRKHKIEGTKIKETKIKDAENVKAVEEEEEVERLRKHITESSLKKLVICVSKVDDDAYKESLRSKKDVNAMNKERSSNMLESNLLKNRESNNYCVEHCSPTLELEGNNFESSTNSLKSFDTHSLDTVERLSIDSAGSSSSSSSSSTKSDIESNKQTELKDGEFLNKTRTTSQQKTLKSIPTVSAKTKVKCNTVCKKYPTRNRISFMPNNSISTSKSKNHFNRKNNAKITIKNSKLAKAKNDSVTNITRRKVYRKLVSFEPMEANAVKPLESSRSVGKKKERTSIDEGRTRLRHEETSKEELPSNSEQISVNSGCVLKTFESNCDDDDELGTKMSLTDSSDLPLERKASEKELESQSGEISGSENETCSNRTNTREESELNCENKKAKHFCLNKHGSKIVCTDKHLNNSGQNEIINEENSSKKSDGKEREQNLTNDSLAITNSDSEDLKNTRKDCLNKTDIVEKNESLRSKKNEESATTEEKNRVVSSEEKKETNNEIRQNKSETKRKLDLNLQQGLQRGRRRSPSKLSLRMKQEVQEQCCGHWFPNTKGFIRHLIENSKNEADSLHAAKLIDLGMQKCTVCAVWLNFITLKKHLKKVHDDIKPVNQQNCTLDSVPDTKTENNTTVVDQDLKTKDLKTKDLKTKDLKTKDLKTKDLKTKALKMKDLRTKALRTKALRTKDLKTKDLKTKDLKTKDLKTKDLKTKDLKTKDLKTKDLKTKGLRTKGLKTMGLKTMGLKTMGLKTMGLKTMGLKTKDLKTKDLKTKDLKTKDLKTKDLKTKDLKTKDLKTKDLKAKDLKAKDLKAKDLKAKDLKAKDSKAKDSKAKDSKAKDSKAKDSKAKDSKAKDSKAKDSMPNVLMSDEAVKPKPKSRKPVFEKRTQKPCPMSKKRNSDSSENNDRIICDLNQDPKSTESSIAIYSIEDLPNHFKPFIIMPRCKMKIKKKRTRLKNTKKSPLDSEKTSLLALKKKLNDFKDLEEIKNSLDITKDQLDAPGDLCEKKLVDTKIKDSDTPVTEKMGERQTPKLRKTDALKFKRKPKAQKTPLNKSGNLKQQKQCNSEPLPSRSLNDKQIDKELKDNSENTLVSKNNKIKARRHSIESNPVRKPIRKRKSRHSLTESGVIKESAVIRATPLGRIKIRGNKMRGRPLRRRRCGFHSSGSSDGSSDSSESSSFSDFEREFLDDDDDSKENEENIPTVELDLFTLSSFNEDVSVLLVDPKNPNFKVFASMDAIFVGDSALGDVTNQVGYISDNNNVVYVNPSHFLFPKVGSSESEIPVLKSKKPLNSLHRLKEKEVIQTNIKKTVKKNVVQPNMKLTATTLLASNCKENSFSKASNDKENSFIKSSIIKKEVVTLGKLKQETVKSIKSEIKVSKEVFLSISKASTESKTTAEVKIDKLPEQDQVRKEISQPRKEASVTILKQDKSEGVKCESKAVEASSGFPKREKQGSARETHDNKVIIIKTSMKKDSERRNIKKTNSEIKAQAFSSHKKNISSGNIISLGEAVLAVAPSVREEKVLKTFTLNPVKNVVQGLETDVPYKVLADSKNPIIPNNIDYSNLDMIDVIDCNSSNNPINVCSLYSNEKSQTHKENPTTNLPQSHCSKIHSISVNSPVKISPPAEPKSFSPVKISPAEPKSLSPVKISPFAEPKSLSPIKISPFAEPKSLTPVKISTESRVVIASAEIVPFGTLEGGVCLEEVMQQESNNLIVNKDEDLHTPSKASSKETKEVNLPPPVTESEREKSPKLECDSLDDLSNLEVDKFSDLESISDPCPPGDFSDVVKGNNLWSTPLLFTLENSSKAPDTDPDDVPLILLSPKSNQNKLDKDEKEDNKDDLLGIPLSQIPDFLSPSKNLLSPFGDQVQKLMNDGPVELSPNTVSAALSPNVKGTKSKKSPLQQVDELLKVSYSVKSSPEKQGTLFSNKVVNTDGNTLSSIEKENSKAKHEEEILPHSLFEGIPPVHQDNLTKKKRHKRKKHKKVDESRAVDETFQFQGGPLPSADCVPQKFVKRSSSRPDSDILKMKILLKDLPTHDVSSLFKKQRSHKRKKKKHTKKKRKEREEVDTSVSPSKKKRYTLETPVISPCELKMDEIEDIAKDGLLSVCNKVKENKDGELIKDEGGNNKEERMSGEVGKKGDIAREKKQTRSNREEEKRSKKEDREDEVVEDKDLIVKNRNKKLVLKQFDSFSMTPPVSENVLSSPDRISEDEIVDIEGIDAEMDLTSMKINVREEIPEVLKDPPDGVKKDPIPTDAVNISDYVDKKSPKNLSLRSWLERGSKLITDQQSSVINSRVVKEASELVTLTTTTTTTTPTPILNVKPSHHVVDDRLWHSRGAKLKAQVMITDHQRGITDSSVKGELRFSPIKSEVPSPVTRKSGKKKTDLSHTKDIRSYFSQPGVYSAKKSPSLKSPPCDSRPQPLYFKSSPPPSPSSPSSNSPSTSLSTSSTSFKTTTKTRKKLTLQTPPNPRPSKITNFPSLSSEKKRKRKRMENNMDIRLFFTDRKSTKDSSVCYLPPAKKPRLSNVKTEPDQNQDDDDFEGFHTCPRQWGLRSKMLQKYVDVLDMNTWFNCDRFPVPVDQLCDWNEDQLNRVLFEEKG